MAKKKLDFFNGNLEVVLDMAADTTGNKSLDCIRTNQLCAAIEFSSKYLKPNGVLVSKLFYGEDFRSKDFAKTKFEKVQFLNLNLAEMSQKKLIYTAQY